MEAGSCGSRKSHGWVFLALIILSRSLFATSFLISAIGSEQRSHYSSTLCLLDAPVNGEAANIDQRNEEIRRDRLMRFSGIGRVFARVDHPSASEDLASHLIVVERLHNATVAVIGVGGVGSWAAEALARSGVGNLILIDLDDICTSNTNRQLHAMTSAVGKLKVDEMQRRILDINPHCNVTSIHDFVTTDNVYDILDRMLPELNVCLDAIDGAKEKTALIAACTERRVPIVTCGGAAGRIDATQIVVDDLTRVMEDRLLATCRKELRKRHGFERGLSFVEQKTKKVRRWRIPAVYSTELTKALPNDGDVSSLRRCDGSLGTACFVTGTVGFAAAGKVVEMIANGELARPRKR